MKGEKIMIITSTNRQVVSVYKRMAKIGKTNIETYNLLKVIAKQKSVCHYMGWRSELKKSNPELFKIIELVGGTGYRKIRDEINGRYQ